MRNVQEILKEHLDRKPEDLIIVTNKDGKLLVDFSNRSNLVDLVFMKKILDVQLEKEISLYLEKNTLLHKPKKDLQ